jgi:hypothetical protein
MKNLKIFLTLFLIFAILAAGIAGVWFLMEKSHGYEDTLQFYFGILYGMVIALFISTGLLSTKFVLLNLLLIMFPKMDFDELKVPILIVELVIVGLFKTILIYIIPMNFRDL